MLHNEAIICQKRILFGEWLPDQPDTTGQDSLALDVALNVYSSTTGYAPFPKTSLLTEGTPDGEDINQLFLAKKDAEILALAGTDNHIYLNTNIIARVGTGDINDISKTGGYSNPVVAWDFEQFGDVVLATNGTDKIQKYSINEPAANLKT